MTLIYANSPLREGADLLSWLPITPSCWIGRVKRSILFITGTDTGVGKTVLACLLTRYLLDSGVCAAALKPVCSGGRSDARRLRIASRGALKLDEINPWHFKPPWAPLLAARAERRKLKLSHVLAHARRIQNRFQTIVMEGAGGLLSPLGEGFDSGDLITELSATPVVVCPNQLGAINQCLLVLAALPRAFSRRTQVVLVTLRRQDSSAPGNHRFLAQRLGAGRVHLLPWIQRPDDLGRAMRARQTRLVMQALAAASGARTGAKQLLTLRV